MNKKNIFTAAGIALSFVIAIGGWFLTSALIDMRSDALLSVSGVTWINTPAVITPTPTDIIGEDFPDDPPGLVEHEIVSILHNWETPGREMPHEPMEGQIKMEEALAAGQTALRRFAEQGVFSEELLVVDNVNAYLSQNVLSNNQLLDPIFSYWTVIFSGERISITFTINAVTGQVWEIALTQSSLILYVSEDDVEKVFTTFVSDTGLINAGKVVSSDNDTIMTATQMFENGDAYAIAIVEGRLHENKWYFWRLSLLLSTQLP